MIVGRSVPVSTLPEPRETLAWPAPRSVLDLRPITVARYEVWSRQRQARDDTHRRNPITLAKFAQCVRPLRQGIITGILHRALLLSTAQGIDF